jgi:signal transduction histidine kinase
MLTRHALAQPVPTDAGMRQRPAYATIATMRTILRLIALTALLQLCIDAVLYSVITFSPITVPHPPPLISVLSATPTFGVLIAALLADWRGWHGRGTAQILVAGLMVAFTVESVGVSLVAREMAMPTITLLAPMQTPLLFLFIPAALGGWLNGRRLAWVWSALVAAALALSAAISFTLTGTSGVAPLLPLLVEGIVATILCFFVATLADQQRNEQAQLEQAHHALAAQAQIREQLAASQERLRLARELHDTLVHELAGLLMQLQAVNTLIDTNPAAAHEELAISERATRDGLSALRAALTNLRASPVAAFGLIGALRTILEQLAKRSGLQTHLIHNGPEPDLEDGAAEHVYLIVLEALRNIERHAQAACVTVTVNTPPTNGALQITIVDDGVGFERERVAPTRYGLQGMQERAALAGGSVQIESRPGQGTRIALLINRAVPINEEA